jgi:hypothetical protein
VPLADLTIDSTMEVGHVAAVSLDGAPLARSKRILLQAMSEEKPSGFRTEPGPSGTQRILSLGSDPWLVRALVGSVAFHRPDAKALRVTPLDANGMPGEPVGHANQITLEPTTLYYLITP